MENAPQRLAMSIGEAAQSIGLSRAYLYAEVKSGRLKAVKAGKRSLISVAELNRYLSELPESNRQ